MVINTISISEHILKDIFFAITASDINKYEYEITPSAESGYLADIYKLKIKEQRFIVKVMTKNDRLAKSLFVPEFFEREVFFYNAVLPKFISLQKSLGAKESFQGSVPICLKAFTDGTNDFLVLSDLTADGYKSASKVEGFTEEQAHKAVQVLAKFHAMSFAMKKLQPTQFREICDKIPSNYYTEKKRKWYSGFLNKSLGIIEEVIRVDEGADSQVLHRFLQLIDCDYFGRLVAFVEGPSEYSVINHSDSWSTNFMISDKGATLIDFQMIRFGSPMLDLLFAMYSSIAPDLLRHIHDDVLLSYYSTMDCYLSDMGISIEELYPKREFLNDTKKYALFGLTASFTSILLSLSKEKADSSAAWSDCDDTVSLEEIFIISCPKNDYGKKRLVNLVKYAIEKNIM